ncbi:putative hemolysin [Shimia isoporae]|uniref:Putative hemolysin n=1 Tax=Shimia isoporae TaxID=647720 RepID=A0A4R1NXV4_9RHOB|nr:DUF333 domain-containing protein [Shimia isoporae]TCL10022.1 putative hemolysin [Shimia isoporae]
MKPLFATALFAGTLTLAACDFPMSNDPANPSNFEAEYCTNRGHTYEARQRSDGSVYGVCKFAGGGEMNSAEYIQINVTGAHFKPPS